MSFRSEYLQSDLSDDRTTSTGIWFGSLPALITEANSMSRSGASGCSEAHKAPATESSWSGARHLMASVVKSEYSSRRPRACCRCLIPSGSLLPKTVAVGVHENHPMSCWSSMYPCRSMRERTMSHGMVKPCLSATSQTASWTWSTTFSSSDGDPRSSGRGFMMSLRASSRASDGAALTCLAVAWSREPSSLLSTSTPLLEHQPRRASCCRGSSP